MEDFLNYLKNEAIYNFCYEYKIKFIFSSSYEYSTNRVLEDIHKGKKYYAYFY